MRPDVVLIASSDAVGAALLGALVETLGYQVRFHHREERPDDSFRRERPRVALVDAHDTNLMTTETLGHASMRGISVVIYGPAGVIEKVRRLFDHHSLNALLMPPSLEAVDQTLRKVLASSR